MTFENLMSIVFMGVLKYYVVFGVLSFLVIFLIRKISKRGQTRVPQNDIVKLQKKFTFYLIVTSILLLLFLVQIFSFMFSVSSTSAVDNAAFFRFIFIGIVVQIPIIFIIRKKQDRKENRMSAKTKGSFMGLVSYEKYIGNSNNDSYDRDTQTMYYPMYGFVMNGVTYQCKGSDLCFIDNPSNYIQDVIIKYNPRNPAECEIDVSVEMLRNPDYMRKILFIFRFVDVLLIILLMQFSGLKLLGLFSFH